MQFEKIASGFSFLEAPRVDEQQNLYFSDVALGGLYRRSPDGGIEQFLPDRRPIGGIALNDDGSVICSGPGGIICFDPGTGAIRSLLSEIDGQAISSVNDIQPDAFGSLYGGTVNVAALAAGLAPRDGVLFRIDPPGQVTVLWGGISISNGLGFSPCGNLLYHVETLVGIWVYELGADRKVRCRRLFSELADCDGLAVDAEGGVWVAACKSGQVVRINVDGSVAARYSLPMQEVLSLTFGGQDMKDLYVVTGAPGAISLSGAVLDRSASIFRGRSPVPGLPVPKTRF